MNALTFGGTGVVRFENVPDPGPPGPGEAVVEVELTAICGSDLHVYRGHEVGLDVGTIMGHEFLGRVVAVGSDVTNFAIGDRIVSAFSTSCGSCFFCREGLTARCDRGDLFGWVEGDRGIHGGQAEYVRVPLADTSAVVVPDSLGASPAALFAGDILATGLYCAESGGVAAGKTVTVLGCGPVGLMSIIAARELGAETVWAVDSIDDRLQLAAGYGADPIALESTPVETVRRATMDRGADIVLEAVGSPAASRLACDIVRPGGTIAAAGVHTEAAFGFSPVEAYDKNLTYRAGRCSARTFMDRALAIASSGRYDLNTIVSHELSLAEGARGYDIFDRRVEGCTKVVLRP